MQITKGNSPPLPPPQVRPAPAPPLPLYGRWTRLQPGALPHQYLGGVRRHHGPYRGAALPLDLLSRGVWGDSQPFSWNFFHDTLGRSGGGPEVCTTIEKLLWVLGADKELFVYYLKQDCQTHFTDSV